LFRAVRKAALSGTKTVISGVESSEVLERTYEAKVVVSAMASRDPESVLGRVK
jgi:hypothetical protein